ncbi:hypothetical protein HYH02_013497 [Chlamydomonas schloesseri]|uniref:Uncharacterized protein n=1 Tax=Chlamydomonas schloesseri TaxID=2026947 RepID=A0A835VZ43_9CHLO|nr:hypothetical protein HYH02_013497 [Chlamydomonas schloesseri]|eukprot:KAG2430964.1 hypothetical protein HYH02_013497 [Chlamydomonas schloesseri]
MAAGSSPDSTEAQTTSSSSTGAGEHMAGGAGHVPPAAARPYLNGHSGPGMAPAGDAVGGSGAPADDRPGMGTSSLPPLRLDFLDLWAKMQLPQQDGNAGGSGWQLGQPSSSSSSPFSSPSSRSSRQGGNTPGSGSGATGRNARSGGSGASGGRRRREPVTRSRDDRARQLVLAAKTLVQLRLVVERHLPDMGPGTAALALSRLAGLAAATQRLRRAQLQQHQEHGQEQEQPAGAEVRQTAPAAEQKPAEQEQASDREPLSPTVSADGGSEAAPTSTAPAFVPGAPTASAEVQLPPGTLKVELPLAGQAPAAASSSGSSSSGNSPRATMSTSLDDEDDSDIDMVDGTGAGGGLSAVGRAAADGGARVPRSSLRLMRRMLYHIAACVAPDLYTAPQSPQDTSASALASTSSPATSASTASTSTSTSFTFGGSRGNGRGASSSKGFSPPEHRAKLAGSVLAAMARVGLRPDAEDSRALGALLEASRPDLFLANPAQLCRLASSLPLLRLAPSARWLDHFAVVSRSKMYAASPLQLAAYVWALARLGYHPGDLWLYSLTQQLSRDGRLAAASAGQLCEVLWALHRMGFSPDPDWRAQAAAAVAEVVARDVRSGAGASGAAGLSRSSGPPADADAEDVATQDGSPVVAAGIGGSSSGSGSGHQSALVSGSSPGARASQWSTTGSAGAVSGMFGAGGNTAAEMCSLLLWAVRTGTAPVPAALESCLDRLQPHLRSLRRVHLLRLLLALAESGHRPREELMARVLGCLQPKLASMSATHLTQSLVSISQLRFVPPQAWLMAFLRASRAQLRHYTPAHVTATYQVFAGWQLRPPRSYLEALHSYMDGLLPGFNAKGLATVLQSMSALGVKPQRRWLLRALEALAECGARGIAAGSGAALAEQFRSGQQSQAPVVPIGEPELIGEEAALVAVPRAGLSAAQQQHQLRQQQRASLAASLVTAICSLRGVVQLEAQLHSQPQPQQDASNPVEQAAGGQFTGADSDGFGEATAALPASASAATDADGRASAAAPAALLLPYELWSGCKAVTDVCRELLDVMSGPQLARLVNALARINFYPGREFLAAHSRATARAGAQLLPEDKEAVAGCYSRLAALAPLMAAEARRQADLRQARTAVLVPDPWAGVP